MRRQTYNVLGRGFRINPSTQYNYRIWQLLWLVEIIHQAGNVRPNIRGRRIRNVTSWIAKYVILTRREDGDAHIMARIRVQDGIPSWSPAAYGGASTSVWPEPQK